MRDQLKRQNDSFNRGRRVFLKSLLAGSALLVAESLGGGKLADVLAKTGGTPTYNLPRFEPTRTPGKGFAQSVAAGDPTPTGAVLWTRIDPALVTGISAAQYDPDLVQWLDNSSTPPKHTVRRYIEDGKFLSELSNAVFWGQS